MLARILNTKTTGIYGLALNLTYIFPILINSLRSVLLPEVSRFKTRNQFENYRHLFQVVTYINEQSSKILSYKEKYQYIKTLRAQLSTQEQLLFFWNSISDLGLAWERDPEIDSENEKLITKYNLVKNIPEGYSKYIKVRDFYPLVNYEGLREIPLERVELEKIYQ